MGESNSNSSKKSNAKFSSGEAKPTFLHDFLGSNLSSAAVRIAEDDLSPAISELGSEKQVTNHLEGVPYYGPGARSDLTSTEMSYRSAGNKRSISDSVFMGSSREGFQNIRPETSEGLHLMKMLRNAGVERPRQVQDDKTFFAMNHLRPTSTPHLLGPRWDRAIPLNVGSTLQRMHTPVNLYKDGSVGLSGLSQLAADEGSRTGMKGSGILSSFNGGVGVSDRVPSGVLLSGNRKDLGKNISEPETSALASRRGSAPSSRQMTIFYGGQAHVFDDVHPNKADVIMAVAGSNGGSWSTSYAKSFMPLTSDNFITNEAGMASKNVTPGQLRRNLSITGTNARGSGSRYQISVPSGGHERDNLTNMNHGENAGETKTVQKREV